MSAQICLSRTTKTTLSTMGELVLWYGMFAPCGALLGNHWDYLAPLFNARHFIVHHLLSELFFSEALYEFTSFSQTTHLEFRMKKKGRTTRRFILRQLGHLCSKRPAAFRPLLTEGLALSGSKITKSTRRY